MSRSTLAALLTLLLAAACGDGDQAATPTAPRPEGVAFLVVAIPPANATPSARTEFPWAANFTVNLLEESGIGVELDEIAVQLDDEVTFDKTLIQLAAGRTLVPGRGTLAVPLTIAFTNPQIVADVLVRGVDERGNAIEAVGRLVVIAAQRP